MFKITTLKDEYIDTVNAYLDNYSPYIRESSLRQRFDRWLHHQPVDYLMVLALAFNNLAKSGWEQEAK